jgi:hypothetical protein
VTVRTVNDNTNRASVADLQSLGREFGEYLFAVFDKLFESDGNSPAPGKFEIYENWYKVKILEAGLLMYEAGVCNADVAIWEGACVSEMQARLDELRKQKSVVQ